MNLDHELPVSIGPALLAGALHDSLAGLRHAGRFEAAFRQELLATLRSVT